MVNCLAASPRSLWIRCRRFMPVERPTRAPCEDGSGNRRAEGLLRHAAESPSPHDRFGRRMVRARETSWCSQASDISRPAKWATCWGMRSGGSSATLTGVAYWGPGTMTLTSAQKAIPKATSPPPRPPARPRRPDRNPPKGRLRAGRLDFSPSGYAPSPTTSRSAHHSMASRCTRPPAQAGSTPRVERPCFDMSCSRRSRKSEWSNAPTASWPKARLRASHHPQEGLQRWDGRGRHGPALPSLPARDQRASATVPHNPLRRGGPRPGFALLAAASPWRSRLKPSLPPTTEDVEPEKSVRKSGYRPWAELLQRTFSIDVAQGQAPRFSLAPVARGG